MGSREDLDFLNPHEIDGESEPTKCDLFNECENMPDEAINYVDELEREIKAFNVIIKELKGLVSIVESLDNFGNIYPLDSDQKIELEQAKNIINLIIKKL